MLHFSDFLILEIKNEIKQLMNFRSFVLMVLLLLLTVQTVTLEGRNGFIQIDQVNNNPDLPVLMLPGKRFCYDSSVWILIKRKATIEEKQYIIDNHIIAIKRSIQKEIPAAVVLAMGLVDMNREAVYTIDSVDVNGKVYAKYVHDSFDFYIKFLEVLAQGQDIKVDRYSTWMNLVDTSPIKLKYRNEVLKLIVKYNLWKFDSC